MLMVHMARPGQSEFAYLHSDTLNVRDPAFRAAIAKVTGGNGSRAWRSRHN
jgi:hypothetical protein